MQGGWFHAKLTLVLLMAGFHGYICKVRRDFVAGSNQRSGRFYRWINEIPTILLIAIVLLAVLKPF
jgi:putative membrane protein